MSELENEKIDMQSSDLNIEEILELLKSEEIRSETVNIAQNNSSLKANINEMSSSQTKAYDLFSHNEEVKILQRTLNLKQRDKNVLEQDIKKLKAQYRLWGNNLTALAIISSKIFDDTERMEKDYFDDRDNVDSKSLTMAFDLLVDKIVGDITKIGNK